MRGRQIVKKYLVRSPYKEVVKTIRYGRPKYTVLKSPLLSDATVSEIKRVINHECELLCKKVPSPSYLRVSSIKTLSTFKWECLIEELRSSAPVLMSIISAGTQESTEAKPNVVAQCVMASLLLKHRCKHMCKVQMMVSILLYAGHAAKRVSVISSG